MAEEGHAPSFDITKLGGSLCAGSSVLLTFLPLICGFYYMPPLLKECRQDSERRGEGLGYSLFSFSLDYGDVLFVWDTHRANELPLSV